MRTLAATRFVTPLREGGSLPALVEASDCGLYVLKFRGAGHGVKALTAEIVAGELARSLGLPVPDAAVLTVDAALGRNEPDPEVRDLLRTSVGTNFGLDFLPGALTFDPAVSLPPTAEEASAIVWFDALVTNVDRSARNPNLLQWHGRLWLIDHGASLHAHHDWPRAAARAAAPYAASRDHVLLPWASAILAAHDRLAPRVTRDRLESVLAEVPDDWLATDPHFPDPAAHREAYVEWLLARLAAAPRWLEEVDRARATLV